MHEEPRSNSPASVTASQLVASTDASIFVCRYNITPQDMTPKPTRPQTTSKIVNLNLHGGTKPQALPRVLHVARTGQAPEGGLWLAGKKMRIIRHDTDPCADRNLQGRGAAGSWCCYHVVVSRSLLPTPLKASGSLPVPLHLVAPTCKVAR